jgi:hypothetical protein
VTGDELLPSWNEGAAKAMQKAVANDWTVISMQNDFATVFGASP